MSSSATPSFESSKATCLNLRQRDTCHDRLQRLVQRIAQRRRFRFGQNPPADRRESRELLLGLPGKGAICHC
jgi:hypothetical protein